MFMFSNIFFYEIGNKLLSHLGNKPTGNRLLPDNYGYQIGYHII